MGEMAFVPEGRCDRSHSTRYRLLMAGLARSAWKNAAQKSRPVGYGLIRAGVGTDPINDWRGEMMAGIAMSDDTVPYGTVHSVGAFPGTSCQATIMLSLWDGIHSPRRCFD
jgi:hypothetical protein